VQTVTSVKVTVNRSAISQHSCARYWLMHYRHFIAFNLKGQTVSSFKQSMSSPVTVKYTCWNQDYHNVIVITSATETRRHGNRFQVINITVASYDSSITCQRLLVEMHFKLEANKLTKHIEHLPREPTASCLHRHDTWTCMDWGRSPSLYDRGKHCK